ncbi:MAG TPA: hypothetical protein VN783_00290 [Thermoanaerobaculia bacterium]|nr:hypothetical protein [Thermoanaerobaculia bacterium]
MSEREMRRAVRNAGISGFLIHTLAALWVWRSWGSFSASNMLVWMSFPASLAYLGQGGGRLLALSLACGGLEWAALGALIAYGVGRSAKKPG